MCFANFTRRPIGKQAVANYATWAGRNTQREPNVPDKLTLRPGEYRKIRYAAPWPEAARGVVKVDPVGFDASPMLITLNRGKTQTQVVAAENAETQATTPQQLARAEAAANTSAVPTTISDRMLSGRLSTFEPMYFADGQNGDNLAKFQFSFKYRLLLPDVPARTLSSTTCISRTRKHRYGI
jgi:hypothetical protein